MDGYTDVNVGVNMEFGFHEEEDKRLTREMEKAMVALKDWKWGSYRNKWMPTVYDICCGAGRCVPYYIDYFGYICLHD